jgi:cytoskeletal protein RodZ
MVRRTNQGGSVASFVIIGVILVAGLLSAIYFVNQRGQQARKDQAISATSTKKQATNTTTTTKTPTTTSKTSVVAPTTSNSQTQTQTSNLPATGAELSTGTLMSVFLLSTSITGYVISRRRLEHSL